MSRTETRAMRTNLSMRTPSGAALRNLNVIMRHREPEKEFLHGEGLRRECSEVPGAAVGGTGCLQRALYVLHLKAKQVPPQLRHQGLFPLWTKHCPQLSMRLQAQAPTRTESQVKNKDCDE